MVYVTGDTHGTFQRLGNKKFPLNKNLTKSDYVIILGDFGGVWDGSKEDKYWLDWLNERNFTTLFVDGNHENFDLLESYPVVEFKKGKVRRIRESVFQLMRGEIYTIDGCKFLTLGGAESIDVFNRKPGKSWWEQEIPAYSELTKVLVNLHKHKNKIDYVLTHCVDLGTEMSLTIKSPQNIKMPDTYKNRLLHFRSVLDYIRNEVSYKHWYAGHYHLNVECDNNISLLYNSIVRIL